MSTQVAFYEAWRDLMRSWGFTVHEAAGWRTRDASPGSTYRPGRLYIEHHDASTKLSGNWGVLAYIINNKLANIVTARDGQITICAAGPQNHAGVGSRPSLGDIPANGANPNSLGNEVANDGLSESYTTACTRSIIAGEKAWMIVAGQTNVMRVIGHKEWADPQGRKQDPRVDMDQRRRDVAAFNPAGLPVKDREWDEMATKDEIKAAFREVLAEKVLDYRNHHGNPEDDQYGHTLSVRQTVERIEAKLPGLTPELTAPVTRLGLPVRAGTFRVTSGFGPRGGKQHRGTDFASSTPGRSYAGADVLAMEDGVVIEARTGVSGFEVWVWLRHQIDGRIVDTIYGHMPWSSVLVRAGDVVERGEKIAEVGNEGNSSGPHLHAEAWVGGRLDGVAVDLIPWTES